MTKNSDIGKDELKERRAVVMRMSRGSSMGRKNHSIAPLSPNEHEPIPKPIREILKTVGELEGGNCTRMRLTRR